jgi:hypothetical protein
MHFYSPSPLSLGYIPRRSYRPAPVSTYIDDEYSSPLSFEGLGYSDFSHSLSPRLDAEARYRRALHEMQAAEEEFEAHLSLKRARQAAVLREQVARRDRELAFQAEVERIERSRALHAKLAEEYEWHQRTHQAEVAPERTRYHEHALPHTFVDTNPRDHLACECSLVKRRPTHSGPSRSPVFLDSEVPTLESLLKLVSGIDLPRRPLQRSPLQQSGSRAPFQHRSAEPQPSEKQEPEGDALNAVLEFIRGLAAHATDADNGSESIAEVRLLVRSVDFQV